MPRSRTHARIRAAKRAAGLIPDDPEKTAKRVGHLLRRIWHRFARLEDYKIRVDKAVVGRQERTRAIRAAMQKWMLAQLEQAKAQDRRGA